MEIDFSFFFFFWADLPLRPGLTGTDQRKLLDFLLKIDVFPMKINGCHLKIHGFPVRINGFPFKMHGFPIKCLGIPQISKSLFRFPDIGSPLPRSSDISTVQTSPDLWIFLNLQTFIPQICKSQISWIYFTRYHQILRHFQISRSPKISRHLQTSPDIPRLNSTRYLQISWHLQTDISRCKNQWIPYTNQRISEQNRWISYTD